MAGEYDKSKYTKKERFLNFWYYNKLYIIAAVLVVLFIFVQIHKVRSQPKIAFNVMFFNVVSTTTQPNGLSDEGRQFVTDFMSDTGVNMKKNTVDTQMHLGFDMSPDKISETELMTIQNMGAYVANGDLDILVADESAFMYIGYWEALEDLRVVLDTETFKKLEPYMFYVDQVVIDEIAEHDIEDEEYQVPRPDPRDPSKMQKPIPVGIYLDKANERFNKEFEVSGGVGVVGVYINTQHPELCRAFIDYILE